MAIENILIVDDSSTSRMITRRCLEIAGLRSVEYSEAEDGLKALAFLKGHQVDLVLSDLKMPKMDGATLIRKLKLSDAHRNIPVIIVSSIGSDVIDQNRDLKGVAGTVKKPISPEKMTAALESVFGEDVLNEYDDDGTLGGIL